LLLKAFNFVRLMSKLQTKYLIVVAGPTAVGKTDVAIALAKAFNTSIINADSRQIYTELSIGVAKPNEEELKQVKHYFVNHCSINESFTASDFETQSLTLLETLFMESDTVVVSGGTALYIKALLEGFDPIPDVPEVHVASLNQLYKSRGLIHLQDLLREKDPAYFDSIDKQNHRRIIRALSVIEAHGKPFSSYLTKQLKARH